MRTSFLHLAAGAVSLTLSGSAFAADYVAHEWGTFTSVQGSDGIGLVWNPFETAELPEFVYERSSPFKKATPVEALLAGGKSSNRWLQRMETPVIYFYAEQPLTLDVRVAFPQGLITEWYPQVRQFGPSKALGDLMTGSNDSFVRWGRVQLLPTHEKVTQPMMTGSHSHYFAARETDSKVLRAPVMLGDGKRFEVEKFLFYRGVGNFAAPLHVSFPSEREVHVDNSGDEPLRHVFLLEVQRDGAAFVTIDEVAQSNFRQVALPSPGAMRPTAEVAAEIGSVLEKSLISEGLYPREASAMIKTWRDSWFSEPGVRVLYLLPRAWTDRTLPLSLEPAPGEIVRVMVGRAEVFTPALERDLRENLARSAQPAMREQALAALRDLKLGRFAEPALSRLAAMETRELNERIAAMTAELLPKPVARP
jgi:hypothetical protein